VCDGAHRSGTLAARRAGAARGDHRHGRAADRLCRRVRGSLRTTNGRDGARRRERHGSGAGRAGAGRPGGGERSVPAWFREPLARGDHEIPQREEADAMIARLIELSIRNRFLVLLLVTMLVGAGVWSMFSIRLDAIPDLSDVQVIVVTEYPGQNPQVVDDQ